VTKVSETKQTIIKIVADMINRDSGDINGDSRLAQDLGIKSANRIGLSALLEDQFGIELTIFDIMKVKTMDELYVLIKSKQN
jgi:acyl carrier protein